MYTVETAEVFHQGWPDPDWVRGFVVVIKPLVHLRPDIVYDTLTSSEIEDMDSSLTRITFEDNYVRLNDESTNIYAGTDTLHYGKPGSRMHDRARMSLDTRIGFLLRVAGIADYERVV